MDNGDKNKQLYDIFVSDGYDMESEQEFRNNIKYPDARKRAFDALVADGYEMGEYNKFESDLGFGATQEAKPAEEPKVQEKPLTDAQRMALSVGAEALKSNAGEAGSKVKGFEPITANQFLTSTNDGRVELGNMEDLSRRTVQQFEERKSSLYQSPEFAEFVNKSKTDYAKQLLEEQGITEASGNYAELLKKAEEEVRSRMYNTPAGVAAYDDFINFKPRRRAALEQKKKELEDEYERRSKETRERVRKEAKSMGAFGGFLYTSAPNQAHDTSIYAQELEKELAKIDAAIKELDEATSVEDAYNYTQQHNFFQNAWKGFSENTPEAWLDAFTLNALKRPLYIKSLKNKLERGEELTDDEKTLFDAVAANEEMQAEYGGELGIGYNVGNISAQALPFMAQMGLMPETAIAKGITTGSTKLAAKAASKAVGKSLLGKVGWNTLNYGTRLGGKVAHDVTQAAIMTNTIQLPMAAANVMESTNGVAVRGVNDDGETTRAFEGEKSLGTSLYEQEASMIIDNATELFGNWMFKGAGQVFSGGARRVLTSKGAKKLRLDNIVKVIDAGQKLGFSQFTKKFMDKTKWDGIMPEIMEEEGALVLNHLFGTNQTKHETLWEDITDPQQQLEIALGVGMLSGTIASVNTIGYPIALVRSKRKLSKNDKKAESIFGAAQWEQIKEIIDDAKESDLAATVYGLANASGVNSVTGKVSGPMTTQQYEAMVNYSYALSQYRGNNIAYLSRQEEGADTPISQMINQAYVRGENVTDPELRRRMGLQYNYKRDAAMQLFNEQNEEAMRNGFIELLENEEKRKTFPPEHIKVAVDYLNTRSAYDGMMTGIEDEVDSRVQQSNAIVDSRVNKANGTIVPAVMKQDDRNVYVVAGNLVPYSNGTGIDISASDGSIIIRDAETGEMEQVSPEAVLSVGAAEDPDALKEAAASEIRAEYERRANDEINGALAFTQGETYQISDGNGGTQEIVVLGDAVDENGNPIPDAVNVQIGNAQQVMSKSDIQEAHNALEVEGVASEEQAAMEAFVEKAKTLVKPDYKKNQIITIIGEDGNLITGDIAVANGYLDTDYVVFDEKKENGNWKDHEYTRGYINEHLVELKDIDGNILYRNDALLPSNVTAENHEQLAANEGEEQGAFTPGAKYEVDVNGDTWEVEILGTSEDGRISVRINGADAQMGADELSQLIGQNTAEEEPKPAASEMPGQENTPQWSATAYENKSASGGSGIVPEPNQGMQNGTVPLQSTSSEAKGNPSTPTEQISEGVSAMNRIPRDEKTGEPLFEQAETPDLAWDAIVEQTEGDEAMAQTVADGMVADKRAALDKAEKAKSKGGNTVTEKIAAEKERKAAIEKARNELAIWELIAGTAARRAKEAEEMAAAENVVEEEVQSAEQSTGDVSEEATGAVERTIRHGNGLERKDLNERDAELYSDTQSNGYGKSFGISEYYETPDGTTAAVYADKNGSPAIIISAIDDNSWCAIFKEYDKEGNPTGMWTSKLINESGDKNRFRRIMGAATSLLPEGELLSETKSVSIDGLRALLSQTKHGFNFVYDENGNVKTRNVKLNEGKERLKPLLLSDEEFVPVREQIEKLFENYGLPKDLYSRARKTTYIELPLLQKGGSFANFEEVGKSDKQGNPIDENGRLITERVNSIDELTDEDFTSPTRSVELPEIPKNVADAIGSNGKPVVIKKSVFRKNRDSHKELSPKDSRDILIRALYNPNLVGQSQPVKRPDYRVVIQIGDKNSVVVLDVFQGNENIEVVGWRRIDAKGLDKMKRQAEREGGQILILSPNDGSAAALSALPRGLSSTGKGSESSETAKENDGINSAYTVEQAMEDMGRIEEEWNEKIQDYIFEHYPTQATLTADTTSPRGLAEREAMRKDETLRKMREEARIAVDEADRKVSDAIRREDSNNGIQNQVEETQTTPTEQQSEATDAVLEMLADAGVEVVLDEKEMADVLEANEQLQEMKKSALGNSSSTLTGTEIIEKIRNSKSAEITGDEVTPSDDLKQYKKNALEYGKTLQGTYTNKDTGAAVHLQRGRRNGGINEVLQHDYKDVEHLQSIAAIPQIIENGIYIASESNNDVEKNPTVSEYQHFVCGLRIGGEDYTVRSVYAVDKNGDRYYDHKLTHIEKGKLLDQLVGITNPSFSQATDEVGFGTTPGTKPTTDVSDGKDKKLISLLKGLVSENTNPLQLMTVYHGSGAAFDAFDHSHMGEGEGAQAYGWGTYVTEVEGIARTYAGTTARRGNHIQYDGEPLGDVLDNEYYFDDIWRSWKTNIMMSTDIESLKRNIQTVYIDGRIASPRSKRRKEFERQKKELLADIDNGRITIDLPRNIYTVEIPEDNGKNYLVWDEKYTQEGTSGTYLDIGYLTSIIYKGTSSFENGEAMRNGIESELEKEGFYDESGSISGREFYDAIGSALGGGKQASEFLSRAGFVGIKYPAQYQTGGREDNAKNYVIFNEADAKITERIQFLRTERGEVYGFVKNGKIYLDPKLMNPNTPIHEYTHIWDMALQKSNPELWARGVELMKQTPLWDEVKNNPAYADIAEDENLIASEVHARLTGKEGAALLERLNEEAKKEKDFFKLARKISLVENLRRWIRDAWKWIKDTMTPWTKEEADAVSLEEFVNMPIADLARKAPSDSTIMGRDAEDEKSAENGILQKQREFLTKSEPVSVLSGEEFAPDGVKLTDKVPAFYEENYGGKVTREGLGDVLLDKESVKDSLAHGIGRMKSAAFAAVPEIIRQGIVIDEQSRWKGREYDSATIAAPITIGGERYIGVTIIKRLPNDKNRFYLHEVALQKNLLDESIKTGTKADSHVGDIAKLLKKIFSANISVENFENPRIDGGNVSEDRAQYMVGEPEAENTKTNEKSKLAIDIYEEGVAGRHKIKDWKKYFTKEQIKRFGHDFLESWYNQFRSLKIMQEAISQETGKPIKDHENVYLKAEHKSSKDLEDFKIMMRDFVEPLMIAVSNIAGKKKINGKTITQEDIEKYLNCKHGAYERNADFAMRDAVKERKAREEELDELLDAKKISKKEHKNLIAKIDEYQNERYNELREKDYSGLTAIFNREGKKSVHELEKMAKSYCNDFEKAAGDENITELWARVNAMNKYSLEKSYESGIISREQYNSILGRFKYYVPLRGFKEGTSEDVYEYVTAGMPPIESLSKKARGRKSEAANILATMMNMGHSAIVMGNKNDVKLAALYLAKNHQTSALTVSRQWYEKGADKKWRPVPDPEIPENATPEQIRQIIEEFEEKYEELSKADDAKVRRWHKDLNIDHNIALKAHKKEHAIIAKRNGEEYTVWVNGNPKFAQAINGLLNPEKHLDIPFVKQLAKLNRLRARFVTSYNPEFVFSNFERDAIEASETVLIKEGKGYAWEFVKNVKRLLSPVTIKNVKQTKFSGIYALYHRYYSGTLDMNDQTEKFFYEFMMNGGETGYSNLWDIERYQEFIEKELGKGTVAYNSKKAVNLIFETAEFINKGVENTTRFAAYMTSRQKGKSVLLSINDAKEVSVNFNRKGSGKMGNKMAREVFIFLNSSIQGEMKHIMLMLDYPKRAIPIFAAHFALGMLMPIANMMIAGFVLGMFYGDDDDEYKESYWNLSPFDRRNKICIRMKDGTYFKIDLPHNMRAWYGLGEIAISAITGHMDKESIPLAIAAQLSATLPIDPVNTTDIISTEGTLLGGILKNTARATALGGVLDAYLYNEDFLGRPISVQHDYNKLDPEYTKANDHTMRWLVSLSEWSNNTLGGGNPHMKSKYGFLDFNPSKVQYVLEQLFGGTAKFVTSCFKIGEAIFYEDVDMEWERAPFLRKFYSDTNKNYNQGLRVNNYWKWYKSEADKTQNNLKNLRDDNRDVFKKAGDYDRILQSGEYYRFNVMKRANKSVSYLMDAAFEKRETDKATSDLLFRRAFQIKMNTVNKLLKSEGEHIDWLDTNEINENTDKEWNKYIEKLEEKYK